MNGWADEYMEEGREGEMEGGREVGMNKQTNEGGNKGNNKGRRMGEGGREERRELGRRKDPLSKFFFYTFLQISGENHHRRKAIKNKISASRKTAKPTLTRVAGTRS